MAPTEEFAHLAKRYCPSGYYQSGSRCYPNSNWYFWGRWVFAAIVIVVIIALLLMLGCVSARRRRRRGLSPMYGTGWMGGKYNNGPPPPNYGNQNYQPPPPQYGQQNVYPQYTGNTFNSNEGYYGQHNNDVPLQQPSHTYNPNRGPDNYEPPPGPPPSKIA